MTRGPFCSACGTLNTPAARFCQACGARLSASAGATCARCGASALPGDRFCDECGAALPSAALLILEETGWRVALPPGAANVIGREDSLGGAQPEVDLTPYDAEAFGVSRRHASLVRAGDRYTLEDLGSVNLTYVNDQRLKPGRAIPLNDGDRILLGRLPLIFRQV